MVLRLLFAAAAAVGIAGAANAAEQAKPEGDAFEILSVALELGALCRNYRGFEFHYLGEVSNIAFETSGAVRAYGDARKAAEAKGFDTLNVGIAGEQALRDAGARYRDKATKIGCDSGAAYYDTGRIEAFKQMGGLFALILAYRGPESNLPLPKLTPDEGGLVQGFHGAAKELFGAEMPQFEATIPQMAQRRLSRYPSDPDLVLARFIEDQSRAFAILHHETQINNAGWSPRGEIFRDGTPFGYPTTHVSKDGAMGLSLIAAPKAVTVRENPGAKPVTGIIAIGRRDDGAILAGVAAGEIPGAPASLLVKAQSQGSVVRSVTGTRVMDNCPYARCFVFPRDQMTGLAPGASPEPVRFYVTMNAAAGPDASNTDSQIVAADRMRAAMQPR